jgi:nicotinamidase-related amidase
VNVTSEPIRDPITDPLLTPQNSALLVIDYQPSQIQTVTSIDHDPLIRNIVSVARLAKTYGLPIVLSTVNVAANGQPPTIPELREVLSDSVEIDRTQINSWEDVDFRRAVEATGRKKLVMAALWTEVCLAFPALDALRDGYEVFPVVDAVGGTSPEAHRAGLERIVQAGAQPIGWGIPGLRIATRLGSNRHRSRSCGHRAHFSTPQRALKRCVDRSCILPSLAVRAPSAGNWVT